MCLCLSWIRSIFVSNPRHNISVFESASNHYLLRSKSNGEKMIEDMIQRKFDPLHPIAAQNWWVTKVQLETDATLSGTQQDLAPNGVLFGEIKAFSWLNFTSCYSSFIVSFIGVCNNVADALVVRGRDGSRAPSHMAGWRSYLCRWWFGCLPFSSAAWLIEWAC